MNTNQGIPEVDPEIPPRAVSVYGENDTSEDFPVLKAFQQYIDAEQAKARKRMISLCIFFGVMMFIVIGVFVALLLKSGERNQALNDRLVEYVMKERDRSSEAEVQRAQNSVAIGNLTSKIDELQRKLADENRRATIVEKTQINQVSPAAEVTNKPKGPSVEELEIERLKLQLASEKKRAAELEAKRKAAEKKAEIEAYRRKYYPELYQKKSKNVYIDDDDDLILDDDEEDDEEEVTPPSRKRKTAAKPVVKSVKASTKTVKSAPKKNAKSDDVDSVLDALNDDDAVSYFDEKDDDDKYMIPVDIKGKKSKWRIPEE